MCLSRNRQTYNLLVSLTTLWAVISFYVFNIAYLMVCCKMVSVVTNSNLVHKKSNEFIDFLGEFPYNK